MAAIWAISYYANFQFRTLGSDTNSPTAAPMPLNIRQIEVFRAVMITSSVSGAARLLHVSQPAVSRMLAYAEQRLGFALFERANSRLLPTPEGRDLFREIEHVYRGVQQVNDRARELGEGRTGVLHLVSSPSLGYRIIPTAIARFRQDHAQVKVTFRGLNVSPLIDSLLSHQAELGLAIVPVEHPNLIVTPLCVGDIVCIFPAQHPLGRLQQLTVADLRPYPLVAYAHGTPFGTLVETLFDNAQEPLRIAVEVASPQDACSIVAAGGGIALVDSFSIESRPNTGLAARPIAHSPKLTASLLHSRSEPLSLLARAFCDTLSEITREHGFATAGANAPNDLQATIRQRA